MRGATMHAHMPITISDDAVGEFIRFCRQNGFKKFLMVADGNTAQALGDKVHQAVQGQGWDVKYCVLNPEGLHSDGTAITRVLNAYDAVPRTFVAVGSGTITDITRFTSHRSQNTFISFPTAPSVDAYASKNAPITIGKLKGSVLCHAPIAIFTDMPTICRSPKFLTASGFGDLISKLTSTCDWKISHLVWESPFDAAIYTRGLRAGQSAAENIEGIRKMDKKSMRVMMESQFESGFCMADFNNSAPASGAEHHIAHIWEMLFHWENRKGLLHGNAVGVAAVMSAEWYQRLKTLSRADAAELLGKTEIPTRSEQTAALRKAFPYIAEAVVESKPIYLQLSDAEKFNLTKERMLEKWDAIQACAQHVPDPDTLRGWIKSLGGPTTPEEIGVSKKEAELAKEFGHYLRERFSINIIRKLFGWD
ncbi:MAG: iron-containing alcohol dehydrogenase [Anaerolineaceae bacterium]|nr:iron-containing alcohol dehydrogenase [Anaerolineaceae bacterium]